MPVNRIVTRGMGASRGKAGVAGLITQGYGGFFRKVAEAARKLATIGRSSAQRAVQGLEEVVVWAKLIRVNERAPQTKVEGFIRVGINKARNYAVTILSGITTRALETWKDIKITINRIR
jgi:hypothetical protein